MEIVVTPIVPRDRDRWAELWRGYLEFYEIELPLEIYEHTWQRLTAAESPIRGFGARPDSGDRTACRDRPLSLSRPCMDDPRGLLSPGFVCRRRCSRHGCGRRLIEAVAGAARERGCARLYWTTKADNAAARLLYDRIARFNGFIRYDYPLE